MHIPGEDTTAVAAMTSSAARLQVGFKIRLNCVTLETFVTFPLLFGAVLPTIVLLDSNKVAKSMSGIVMKARSLGTYVDTLVISRRARLF